MRWVERVLPEGQHGGVDCVRFRRSWRMGLTLSLALASCRPAGVATPNILVVLIDTLRADRLGAYGNQRGLTPFLDTLAARGTVFLHAYSASSRTAPAVAALFTSRYPSQLQLTTAASSIGDTEMMLAERLQQAGYVSAGFLANFQLTQRHGYAQGFSQWWAPPRLNITAGQLRDEVTRWLDERAPASGASPCFLYVHYLEPHAPYDPPEPYRDRFMRGLAGPAEVKAANNKVILRQASQVQASERDLLESLYDGEVAAVDDGIRLLFEDLGRRSALANTVIVVTADHGEEFTEHGGTGHGLSLYNEVIRIPLIVIAPNQPGGRVVHENVSLIDLAPTLLDLAGLAPEVRFEGRSLVPLLGGDDRPRRGWADRMGAIASWFRGAGRHETRGRADILVELPPTGGTLDIRRHRNAMIRGDLKLMVPVSGPPVLYDLAADPGERVVNPAADPRAGSLVAAVDAASADLASRAGTAATQPLSEGAREKMRALGYDP